MASYKCIGYGSEATGCGEKFETVDVTDSNSEKNADTLRNTINDADNKPTLIRIFKDCQFDRKEKIPETLDVQSNVTIVGIMDGSGNFPTIYGGKNATLSIVGSNVIIRNLNFNACNQFNNRVAADCINIGKRYTKSKTDANNKWDLIKDIWIDHCSFVTYRDGLGGKKAGNDFLEKNSKDEECPYEYEVDAAIDVHWPARKITISYCLFPDYDKTMLFLVGLSDKADEFVDDYDSDRKPTITLSNNVFYRCQSRCPKNRGYPLHLMNNLLISYNQ